MQFEIPGFGQIALSMDIIYTDTKFQLQVQH